MNGWYSQGITVAYERARGVRAVNQRRDGRSWPRSRGSGPKLTIGN